MGKIKKTRGYCDRCQNTGSIDCLCGGDQCICENYGEKDCPYCYIASEGYRDDDGAVGG